MRPSPNSILNYHSHKGIKLLTWLKLGLSHVIDRKFKHIFQDSLNPICNCGADIETTPHYFLHCSVFSDEKLILVNNIQNIDNNILNLNNSRFSEVLLLDNYFKYHNRIYRLILEIWCTSFWPLISITNLYSRACLFNYV